MKTVINVKKIKENCELIDKQVQKLDSNLDNLFNEIFNLDKMWKGPDLNVFLEKQKKERELSLDVIESIKKNNNYLKSLYSKLEEAEKKK